MLSKEKMSDLEDTGTLSGGRAGRAGGESEFSSEVVWERKGLAFKNMSSVFDGSAEKSVLFLVSSPIERISSGKSIKMRGFHTEWTEAPGYPSSRNCKRIPLTGPCALLAHHHHQSSRHPAPRTHPQATFSPSPCSLGGADPALQEVSFWSSFPILPAINPEPLAFLHFLRSISIVQQLRDAPLSQPPSVCRRERIYLHQHPIIRGNL